MSETRKEVCIGCLKTIEDNEDRMMWNKEYQKWKYTNFGMLCPNCYPIYKNLIRLFKDRIRKDFAESKKEMTFRFNENLKDMN